MAEKEISLNKIKEWIKKNKVIDIIVFGSFVRGKENPNDLDLCILIKDTDEKKSLDLVDSLGRLTDDFRIKCHINILTSSAFIGSTLAKTLLNEGFSISKEKDFSKSFGMESKSLFVYELKKFTPTKRVQFHYLLKGRYESKGILDEIDGTFIGTGSILIPNKKEDILKRVFDKWEVNYQIHRLLVS